MRDLCHVYFMGARESTFHNGQQLRRTRSVDSASVEFFPDLGGGSLGESRMKLLRGSQVEVQLNYGQSHLQEAGPAESFLSDPSWNVPFQTARVTGTCVFSATKYGHFDCPQTEVYNI